jgi:hypothetical protein
MAANQELAADLEGGGGLIAVRPAADTGRCNLVEKFFLCCKRLSSRGNIDILLMWRSYFTGFPVLAA